VTKRRKWTPRRWIALAETTGTNTRGGRVDYEQPLWNAHAWDGKIEISTLHDYKSQAKRAVERWLTARSPKEGTPKP